MKNLIIYIVILLIASRVAELVVRIFYPVKNNSGKFPLKQYITLISSGLIAVGVMVALEGLSLLYVSFSSMILGVILEANGGYISKKILGEHIWKYERFTYKGYTSLLAIPAWGITGVLFYLLSKVFLK